MAKFRKRPVVVEAFQWDGFNVQALADWAAKADLEHRKRKGLPRPTSGNVVLPIHVTPMMGMPHKLEITTLNGDVEVAPEEWVICGVHGEFYPCADAIFRQTYEAVDRE